MDSAFPAPVDLDIADLAAEAGKPSTPYGAQVRKDEAIRRVQDRFARGWHKLLADRDAEIRCIERVYARGGFE